VSFSEKLSTQIDIVDGRPVNYRLGSIVAALLDRQHKQDPDPDPPPMPDVPLKLVLTGKPFAGKKMAATRLAETYNLQVVDFDEVVRECLALSKRPDLGSAQPIDVLSFTAEHMDDHCAKHEDSGNPYVRELQEIGYELQELLDHGEAVHNLLYVHMIVTKIRSLFPDRMPRPQQPALDEGPGAAAQEEQAKGRGKGAVGRAILGPPMEWSNILYNKGERGQGRARMTPEQAKRIDEAYAPRLRELGDLFLTE